MISDGQPSGYGYGVDESVEDLKEVRNKIFAFSIDADGDYLTRIYGKNNFCIVSSDNLPELGDKLAKVSNRIISEFSFTLINNSFKW